jgi:hypothetical protein
MGKPHGTVVTVEIRTGTVVETWSRTIYSDGSTEGQSKMDLPFLKSVRTALLDADDQVMTQIKAIRNAPVLRVETNE